MLLGRQAAQIMPAESGALSMKRTPFPTGFHQVCPNELVADPECAQSRSGKLFHSKSSAVIFTLASCLLPPAPQCVGMFTFPLAGRLLGPAIKEWRGLHTQPHCTHAACSG